MRKTSKRLKRNKIKDIIFNNIYSNLKEYVIVTIILLIGVIIGVIFINNSTENQISEIQNYINNFTQSLKGDYDINKQELLKNSLTENIKLTVCMWLIGSTVVGIPIVLGIVLYRGFCIGYTASSLIAVLGLKKGVIFILTAILLQNIIFIPVLISLTVSGIKLYKSIMKDRRKENIKIEIVRHTIFSLILFLMLIISTLIEVYVSSNLLKMSIQIF